MLIITMAYEMSSCAMGEELLGTTESGADAIKLLEDHQKNELKKFIQENYKDPIELKAHKLREVGEEGSLMYRETVCYNVYNSDEGGTFMYSIWRS